MDLINAIGVVEGFIESKGLDHGNSEVFEQDGDLYFSIEGTNHLTLGEWLIGNEIGACESDMELIEYLKYVMKERVRDFDVDEEFTEVWSEEFGRHNGFTPRQFMKMLEDDAEYLEDVVRSFSS